MSPTRSPGRFGTFLVLLAGALLLTAATLFPLWQPLVLALILAGAMGPAEEWLAARFRGRRLAAAALLVLLVIAVLLPLTWIVLVAVREAIALTESVAAAVQHGGVSGLADLAPASLRPWVTRQIHSEPQWLRDLIARLPVQGLALLNALGGALSATGSLAFHLVMLLIALYFLLVDGPRLGRWVREVSPLSSSLTAELIDSVRGTSSGVLLSAFATAGVQALVAWVGYLIARAPEPLFFAALTFFAAFIPSVGTALIGIPVALFLVLSGRWVAGLFLALWSLFLTGTIDNALKPWLAHGRAEMHGGLLFFAMVGGILIFGALGLVIGPVAVSLLLSLVRLGWREFGAVDATSRPPGGATPG